MRLSDPLGRLSGCAVTILLFFLFFPTFSLVMNVLQIIIPAAFQAEGAHSYKVSPAILPSALGLTLSVLALVLIVRHRAHRRLVSEGYLDEIVEVDGKRFTQGQIERLERQGMGCFAIIVAAMLMPVFALFFANLQMRPAVERSTGRIVFAVDKSTARPGDTIIVSISLTPRDSLFLRELTLSFRERKPPSDLGEARVYDVQHVVLLRAAGPGKRVELVQPYAIPPGVQGQRADWHGIDYDLFATLRIAGKPDWSEVKVISVAEFVPRQKKATNR
jgi:hypothetical protein